MDPVTHVLTGAVLARAGFNRRAAYATAAMAIAAELPDIDTVAGFFGPITGFEHHRGITHTFLAVPFEAAFVTVVFYGVYRLRSGRKPPAAPWSTAWLFAGTLLALLSHLLLDWTNNYGLRPFFPFNPRWYAGSFVFIVEPLLLLILAAALVGPALFGLINQEIGARRRVFRGRPSAIAALVGIAVLYGLRYQQHERAIALTAQLRAGNNQLDTLRLFASPVPLDPFTWHVVADTPAAYQLSTINTRTGVTLPATPSDTLFKPPVTLPLLVAKRTLLGRVYLDWSSYPVLNEEPDTSDPNHPLARVTFADARFMYNVLSMHGRDNPPISGMVLLDMQAPEGQRVVEQTMSGKPQR